jgi:hypothetical protein
VDFSARHYARYVSGLINLSEWEDMGDGLVVKRDQPTGPVGMQWRHPFPPPPFVWCRIPEELPKWLHLVADRHTTERVVRRTVERKREFLEVIKLAVRYYEED